MGDAGGFLRYSRGVGGLRPSPAVLGWGVVDGAITVYHGTKKPVGGRGYPGWSCCRSPVQNQNPGSESRRSPGQRLGGERSPGSPTIRVVHRFSLGFQPLELSARKSQRPEPQ